MSHEEPQTPGPSSGMKLWAGIIQAVQTPLGLFALLILVVYATLIPVAMRSDDLITKRFMGIGLVVLLFTIVLVVLIRPELFIVHQAFRNRQEKDTGSDSASDADIAMAPDTTGDEAYAKIVNEQGAGVLFADDKERPTLGYWFHKLRPYLHQAVHYSIPTYYLDMKLNVVDWNIAFELVFADLIGDIRGKHVNWFIARLANAEKVFDQAREFTKDVQEKGAFPYVHMEPIDYKSSDFGLVRTTKVAAQLSDPYGKGKGWVVALIPREIKWELFQEKLYARIKSDKRWSVYSASYDRVLLEFPPYEQLIRDVVSVVPSGNMSVADLGCGTGNVTNVLLKNGHRVTAIEDNLGMLDRFASKQFDPEKTKLIKSSAHHMGFLPPKSFDAVVMVNVLYAVDDPLGCLRAVCRLLKPGGVLGLSTTHRETDLSPLLKSIEETLERKELRDKLADDWETVYKVNKSLERTVVRRHTRDEVREMIELAGFEIIKDVPSTYEGAVMLIHARKRNESFVEKDSDSSVTN